MPTKPWYKVVTPREDLREGKPLDASEFAVHLDKVRTGTAPADYRDASRFFDRTYLTGNLLGLAAETVRRLSGETTQTSAVFNMTTQFGGGKTHALTLLYHLATNGAKAMQFRGVADIVQKAGIKAVPDNCAVGVFVGTEFDSITGRGGSDGTPLRKTPWGELAFQIGGEKAFALVAEHDKQFREPKGDVIQQFLPKDRPCLILLDEVVNYVSTYRDQGYHNRLYNFVQSLSETVRGMKNVVMVASIPKSEFAYTDKDEADQQRFKNLLDRLGKAVLISVETETAEIIRRRLFEWDEKAVGQNGRVLLPRDAHDTCKEYAQWVVDHRQQLPDHIKPDHAQEQFLAAYPFHPVVLSVFERKWQTLPRFQQTRGVLRLLALWVSRAYQDGFKGGHKDPLLTLGTAPLDDSMFRSAVFEQLGETKLEAAVTTDIVGRQDSHAVRLDEEAVETLKKARLHRKVATTVFFESNGGQAKAEATVPEIRLAVGEAAIDIGNIETALDALTESCYYLMVERNHYRFSLKENLNKRFADRKASVNAAEIEERMIAEVKKVFSGKEPVERVFFPDKTVQVADRPAITFVVAGPGRTMEDEQATLDFATKVFRECGNSARTFKSALVWCIADAAQPMKDEARKLLAWEDIGTELHGPAVDDTVVRQIQENIKKAERDLKESVWRSYKHVILLGKNNTPRQVDLGLVHSSAAETPVSFIINRMVQEGDIEKGVGAQFLVRNWPPAFIEWSTKSVRDAFYSAPQFPRLLNQDSIRDTIAKGVSSGVLGYVGKVGDKYDPFQFSASMNQADIEISDDAYIITAERAREYMQSGSASKAAQPSAQKQGSTPPSPDPTPTAKGGDKPTPTSTGIIRDSEKKSEAMVKGITWRGEVPTQKWMNFYTKVVGKYATEKGVKLVVELQVKPEAGISQQKVEETKAALRDLGIEGDVTLD